MKKLYLSFVLIALVQGAIGQSLTEAKQRIDSVMRAQINPEGKRPVPNFLLYLNHPPSGLEVFHGVGVVGRTEQVVRPVDQFKIASITKTFVAVVVLQLIEEGRLRLDDYASKYLSDLDFLRFSEIHQYEGQPYSDSITVEMLLRHTSGVADIFTDAATRFNLSVLLHKKRQYDTQKVVERFYRYKLHKKALHPPGAGYHYSDMNYMLLGFIIETITGQDLPTAIRTRILEPLDLQDTYFEYYEPVHGVGRMADAYYNRINLTERINTSYEWGGGGLVSTTKDLGTFVEALFQGELLKENATLEAMIDLRPAQAYGKDAGMGIFQYELNETTLYGHGGFYGSIMLYSPERQLTLVATVGQANVPFNEVEVLGSILEAVP